MNWVIDASVGVKWFVPEAHSAEAQAWFAVPAPLHTLAFLFDLEVAAVLWKKVGRGDVVRADADAILAQLPNQPLTRHPDAPLLPVAFDLAVQLGGRMVTADQKLCNGLAGTPWAGNVVWVATYRRCRDAHLGRSRDDLECGRTRDGERPGWHKLAHFRRRRIRIRMP